MAQIKRSLTAVILPLLVVLTFALGGAFPPFHGARANPGELYVAPAAQGSGDCSSWADACTLQTGLGQAVSGDEIWVKAGVHFPGAVGQREATFALQSSVAIYGGFSGWESELGQRDWIANVTVLSGDIDQNDLTDPNGIVTDTLNIQGENAYHVVTGIGIDETAVLDGFVITAGQANGDSPDNYGGGMYNNSGSPTLDNVTFSGNWAYSGGGMYNYYNSNPALTEVTFRGNRGYDGGGMYNYNNSNPTLTDVTFSGNTAGNGGGMLNRVNSSPMLTRVNFIGNEGSGMGNWENCNPTLTDVTFSGNTAGHGGGMWNYDNSNPMLTNVIFSGNSAAYYGGGMHNQLNSSPTLTNVTFSGNTAYDYSGGGLYNEGNSPTLTNVTFTDNTAGHQGGGMGNFASSPTLTNITFSGNSAGYQGGGIYIFDSNPTLTNVILWGNTAPNGAGIYNDTSTTQISYSDIQGCGGSGNWNDACGADGGGNIEADPLFVDAPNGNLRLQLASPAIDAGDNTALPPDIFTDLDGNPRFVNIPTTPDTGSGAAPIVDMGAYEAQFVDVSLSKAVLPPTAAPGEPITFTLILTNTGSLSAAGIVLTDTMPAWLWGVSFTSTLTVTDTGYLPPYVWLAQDLPPGQGGLITVSGVLTVPLAAGIYTNTAIIAAAGDLLAENNMAMITFTVPNLAPVITSAPVLMATEDAPYTYTVTAQDDNGDALTITASTLPIWLTLQDHGDGTATLSGTAASPGDYPVILQITDHLGAFAEQSFPITVAERPGYYTFLPLMLRGAP